MAGFNFKPDGQVLKQYMRSNVFCRLIRGPFGSGKSVASLVELYRRAQQQEPHSDGIRYTRWVVVRNTNPQLKTTTIKTWLQWFPEDTFGKFNWAPPYTHHIKMGDVDAEFIFLSMDRPDDVRKVFSFEYTGGFANEARELPKAIIDAMTSRAGRYPGPILGGTTWRGIVADTNSPDDDHWWPIMAGDTPPPDWMNEEDRLMLIKPDDWEFFEQPPGMLEKRNDRGDVSGYKVNPEAENLKNLDPGYYKRIINGKSKTWIDVYILNKYGNTSDGRPVYPDFRKSTHVAKQPLECLPNTTVYIGMDFGRTPAAIFGQRIPGGGWRLFHELVAEGMGASKFAKLLKLEIAMHVHGSCDVKLYGDPSGEYGSDHDEETYFRILANNGVKALPAPGSNDPTVRIDVVEKQLKSMIEGKPALQICPTMVILIKGFEGGYCYKRVAVSGTERFEDTPSKNKFSHPHDGCQYLFLGAGEGFVILKAKESARVTKAKRTTNVFDRLRRRGKPSKANRMRL